MDIKLDSYDRRILFELDKNSRSTTTQIGKKIRKSKQFVDYRIKRLEELKVLQGYVTVIDYSRLGYKSIRVYLKFHNLTREEQDKLEDELVKDKEIWWIVTLEGKWDLGYATAVKNVLDFYESWDRIMNKYRKYISKRSIDIYSHIKQYPKSYLINKNNTDKGTIVGGSTEEIKINKLDLEILKIIAGEGRKPLLDIAIKLKTSPQVIKNHLKKLEKNKIILGYKALIDVSFLGYRYYKAYINLTNTNKLKELHQFCLQHPNILNINRTLGDNDFELELQAKSFDQFDSIMNTLRKEFAGTIDEYEFVIARKEKKMIYFPFN